MQFQQSQYKKWLQMCNKVLENGALLPNKYKQEGLRLCEWLLSADNKQQDDKFMGRCRLQSYWSCVVPQLQSIPCDFFYNYQVKQPIVVVLAFIEGKQCYSSIDMKLIQWIESGGTRCVPLSINTPNWQYLLHNCHGIIIPSTNKHQSNLQLIQKVTTLLSLSTLNIKPVLALGGSANHIIINMLPQQQQYQASSMIIKQPNNMHTVYINNQNIFKNVNINTKLAIEHKIKIMPYMHRFISSTFRSHHISQQWIIDGLLMNKNSKQSTIYSMHHQLRPLFMWYDQPQLFITTQSINLCHKVICNFIDLIRTHPTKIEEPIKLVSHYKLVFEEGQGRYKIV